MLDSPGLPDGPYDVSPIAFGQVDECARLRTLEAYGLARTAPEADFDHFAAIAADVLGLPVSLVTLVGEDEVTIKGRVGLDTETAPREVAFCSHTILADKVLSVPDLEHDQRFSGNPLVQAGPQFRFYAGAPLISLLDGHCIGALCVIGYEPRPALTEREARLLVGLASLVMDRMELRRLEKAVRDSHALFDRMSAAAPGAVICADSHGIITHWNAAAERLFGWSVDEAIGKPLDLIIPHGFRAAHAAGMFHRVRTSNTAFPGRVVELPALRRDGTTFPAHVSLSRWLQGDKLMFGASIHDITARRAAEDKLRYLAHYDPLTGLTNRARLTELMDEAAETCRTIGFVLLDLDGFKHVNDVLGHGAGDILLTDVAQRLVSAMPERGTIARLGGDEFAALLPDCADVAAATQSARVLQASLEQPFRIGGGSFHVAACAGVTLAAAADVRTVMPNADLALYAAKASGSGATRVFDQAMRDEYDARRSLESEVGEAIRQGEFVLYFQPQICFADDRLVGAEALLRWRHPRRGLLLPGAFLSAVETGPLATKLGDWIIDEACRQAALWREQGLALRIGVNLFDAQLRVGSLASTVKDALGRWRLPGSTLELEVTETVALAQNTALLAPLRELYAEGINIAFDDFGTGFASLSTLKHCPLNRLKIDRSFVSELGTSGSIGCAADRGNVAIIDAILALGRGLGISVIAEGVETAEQAEFLARRGCDEGQGYLFGRPVPPDAMLRLLPAHATPLRI